jgi:excinuclease ABC subunit A
MRGAPGLRIEGARQNNLKNLSLEIPHDRLTVITGVSGSGKSSLAFDTVFAEGHWRYVESLSTYARMFLERLDRPDVDRIEHIRPAVALEQKNPIRTARSTVGTATEIYDYLRLLYAKVGRLHCPRCGAPAVAHSAESIVDALLAGHPGARALITFRLPVPPGTALPELWASLARRGFARVRVDGELIDLAAPPGRLAVPEVAVVLDRVVLEERLRGRLTESIETCLREGGGGVEVDLPGQRPLTFRETLRCPDCAVDLERPQPLLFSFNHPLGACPECKGFGNLLRYDEARVVPDPTRSLAEGAVELCLWLQRAGWRLTPWGRGPAVPMAPACGAGG